MRICTIPQRRKRREAGQCCTTGRTLFHYFRGEGSQKQRYSKWKKPRNLANQRPVQSTSFLLLTDRRSKGLDGRPSQRARTAGAPQSVGFRVGHPGSRSFPHEETSRLGGLSIDYMSAERRPVRPPSTPSINLCTTVTQRCTMVPSNLNPGVCCPRRGDR